MKAWLIRRRAKCQSGSDRLCPTISSAVAGNLVLVWILGSDSERNSAAGRKLRGYDCLAWRACFYEIVEDTVGDRLIKGALVPIRREIKLEGFAFDAEAVWHVIDVDPGKIRLPCDWTNRSEIVRLKMYPVIAPGRI